MISFPRSPSTAACTEPTILFKHLSHFPQKKRAERVAFCFKLQYDFVICTVSKIKLMLNKVFFPCFNIYTFTVLFEGGFSMVL